MNYVHWAALNVLSTQTQKAGQQTQEKREALNQAENQALDLVAHFAANPLISNMPVKVAPRKAAPVVPFDSCAVHRNLFGTHGQSGC